MSKLIYLDNAATTQVYPEVLQEMLPFFSEVYSNPSAIYSFAGEAKRGVDHARETIANVIGAKTEEIYFTGGGSESDNWALKATAEAYANKGKHIITTTIEHHAILHTAQWLEKKGYEITYVNVDEDGKVKLDELEAAIRPDTILISVMAANNEIGTIQPLKEIGAIARKHGVLFHTDAVQAVGNIKIDVQSMNVDMLSMSAHKFYGPKGVGALYVRKGINFERIQDGGHQEKNKRSGTENVAGIVGLGKAIEIATYNIDRYNKKLLALRQYCISRLIENIKDIKINGDLTNRLPGNINVSFKGCDSSDILMKLDEVGICASGGSACSSGTATPSHVLMAIGLDRQWLEGTIRITLGDENTKEDIDYLVVNLIKITNELRNKG